MAIGTAAAILGGAALGGLTSIIGGNKAAGAQADAAAQNNATARQISDDQLALQEKMFDKSVALQQPAIDAGNTARNRLLELLGLSTGGANNGSLMKDFSMADFTADPGYQFRLDQGQQALERSAAARGGLLSGAALKDANNYAQGQASQEWQAAYDRFNTNRTNKLNPLLSLAGSAQTASTAAGNAGQQYASDATNTLGQYLNATTSNNSSAGNARASGYANTANAVNTSISTAINGLQQNSLMDLLNKRYGT